MTPIVFFSPSYCGDLQRFLWLRRSIQCFFRGQCRHIVAVPIQDLGTFREALIHDPSVEIITQNELIADYFYPTRLYRIIQRFAPSQAWRLNRQAGRSGWILQQIAKLSIPELLDESEVAVITDSDTFFLRPFAALDLGISEVSRVLVRQEPQTESGKHRKKMAKARELLKLPPGSTEHHYMSSPMIWYPNWVRGLRQRLENIHGKHWQRVLYEAPVLSEYSLYGVYMEEYLRPGNLVTRTPPFATLMVWDETSYQQFLAISQEEFGSQKTGVLCAVIQSNLGNVTSNYEHVLQFILDKRGL